MNNVHLFVDLWNLIASEKNFMKDESLKKTKMKESAISDKYNIDKRVIQYLLIDIATSKVIINDEFNDMVTYEEMDELIANKPEYEEYINEWIGMYDEICPQ